MKYILFPLIVIDVAINVALCIAGAICALDATMLRDSYRHTLSARAGHMAAEGKPWGKFWAPVIDWLAFHIVGQDDHCHAQYIREARYGGVWSAWSAS